MSGASPSADEQRLATASTMLRCVQDNQLVHMAHVDNVFWQIHAIIRANPALASGGTFQDWIAGCYVDSVTSGLRRLSDERKGVISLWRVLEAMKALGPLLTKDRYVTLNHEGGSRKSRDRRQRACRAYGRAADQQPGYVRRRPSVSGGRLQRVPLVLSYPNGLGVSHARASHHWSFHQGFSHSMDPA